MANVPDTDQPADDAEHDIELDQDDAVRDLAEDDEKPPVEQLWDDDPADSAADGSNTPGPVRRIDGDRWASSFTSVSNSPTDSSSDAKTEHRPWGDPTVSADRPAWANGVGAAPGEPTWRTEAGSGTGWGQARDSVPQTPAVPAPPPLPWTTDVPSGFSWGPDSNVAPIDRSRQGRIDPAPGGQQSPPLPPSPPAAGYQAPPAPVQQPGPATHGGGQHPGPHPGQQAPGSQSRWAAQAPPQPQGPPPPAQWQPQAGPQGWQPPNQQAPRHGSAADLTSGSLVKPAAAVPRVGWRAVVHAVTGGAVNPGLSQAELHRRNLIERATAPVRGCHRIAVVSLKGGIGKTTTTAGIGLTLAEHRGDRVVALDANPDAGTLAERLTGQIDVTVRDLLDNLDSIRSFTDVSAYTSLAARLQVLASEQDPEMSEAFSEAEYCTVSDVLARYFNIVLTDSGTGLLHSAMSGTLAVADSLVVVGSPSVDGASRASKTLDWLIAHGHGELVSRAVAVISTVRPASKELDMVRLREHFTSRVRGVVEIPYDRHLVTGGIIDMTQLDEPTEQAFLELAATVADGFRLPPLNRPLK